MQGRDDPTWPDTQRFDHRATDKRAELLEPSTQFIADRDAYLGQGSQDIGRRIADDQVELFVASGLIASLELEFKQHRPEFIALHDVGTSASLRLLTGLAGAAGARVQRLLVRKAGQGVPLAVLQFVEVPLADGTPVRVYSTDVTADLAQRAELALLLLSHSQLGVLLVGEVPAKLLATQLAPLQDAIASGAWSNRDLLLVPLGSGAALAAQGAQLARQNTVAVQVTPHAAQPKDVWTFIGGAWNRVHDRTGGKRALPTDMTRAVPKPRVPMPEADTQPMPLAQAATQAAPARTAASTTPPTPMPVPGSTRWQAYAERCAVIKGAVACCVFDTHSMQPMAMAGGPPSAERLAQQGTALLAAMNDASRALGLGPARSEASVSTQAHHLLLRPVPGHPGVAVHLVIQASTGNLTLARMQLERIEAPR
ncbi:conserved hypothetical protein [Rubrivivax sp. A210]|uniref:hypothetical protein n=1 Tax=Rubrivivax sp. A210 TaxID=2772301 RepID=UPI0019181552|nr:hypothetical protein [Rubrivivax sp. A210]CAD5373704.1 conserved hypothetical protein [Rubrivivax sp. A210]